MVIYLNGTTGSAIIKRMVLEVRSIPGVVMRPTSCRLSLNMDVHYFKRYKFAELNAVYFTHNDPIWEKKTQRAVEHADIFICQSELTAQGIRERGANSANVHVVHTAQSYNPKELVFGVVGIVYPTGRKGEHLVVLAEQEGFKFKAYGPGWPCETFAERYDARTLQEFYKQIDYLVITSTLEGGPVPVMEALAFGVPVIAPNVGFCWEYACIPYERGEWQSLRRVLRGLRPPTWDDFRKGIYDVCALYGE